MARVITFCPKQTLVGTQTNGQDYFSEVFDIADIGLLTASMQVFGTSSTGTTITGTLQETDDSGFLNASWTDLTPTHTVAGVGISTKQVYSGLRRFVRAKINIPAGMYMHVCFDAMAREP